jgi:dTDP-4-dehydrorhamnose reductase
MKLLITGANGTIGTQVTAWCRKNKIDYITWDRKSVKLDDYNSMESFISKNKPDVLLHLAVASEPTGIDNESWTVNYTWPSELAWICKIHNIKFIFTSTVMVFSNHARGPFTMHSVPDAQEGYGYEKRLAEGRIFYQNPEARVVRLGWQIAEKGSNSMLSWLDRQHEMNGFLSPSSKWYPSCSFIEDTVQALMEMPDKEPGLYMIDSNSSWTFKEIVQEIKKKFKRNWIIKDDDSFVYDQRMVDDRISIPPLSKQLNGLQ